MKIPHSTHKEYTAKKTDDNLLQSTLSFLKFFSMFYLNKLPKNSVRFYHFYFRDDEQIIKAEQNAIPRVKH